MIKSAFSTLFFLCFTLIGLAQFDNPYKQLQSTQLFDSTRILISSHREESALPYLEELVIRNRENNNVAYLLGMCYTLSRRNINRAILFLEKATKGYKPDYKSGLFSEKGAPDFTYYYLVICYSIKGQCDKAKEAYQTFKELYSYEDPWYISNAERWLNKCLPVPSTLLKKKQVLALELNASSSSLDTTVELAKNSAHLTQLEKKNNTLPNKLSIDSTVILATEVVENKKRKRKKSNDDLIVEQDSLLMPTKSEQVVSKAETIDPVDTSTNRIRRIDHKDRLRPVHTSHIDVMTRTVSYTTPTSLYGVQIGAFLTPKFSNYFNGLKNVEAFIDKNGVYRYVMGRFVYRSQAEKMLEHIRELGYKDAFIVDVNTGRNYKEEVIRIQGESIKKKIEGKIDFRIQVGAYKEEIPDDMIHLLFQYENVIQNIHKDITILTIGSYDSYEVAQAYADEIQKQIPDAFIVAYNREQQLNLEEARQYIKKINQEEVEILKQQTTSKKRRKRRKS